MIKTNYYILITAEGKRIPIKTKIIIKTLQIANCFYNNEIRAFYPIDLVKYLIAGGEFE